MDPLWVFAWSGMDVVIIGGQRLPSTAAWTVHHGDPYRVYMDKKTEVIVPGCVEIIADARIITFGTT